ncbi:UNVERIFIED_CONTAM: sensor domain-containing diguanylate cyclase [Microbacterium sp. SLM126]
MDDGGAAALRVGVVHVDRRGVIREANDWFAEWVGTTPAQLIGQPIDELLVHSRDDLLPVESGAGPWMMLDAATLDRAVMVTRQREVDHEVLVISEASARWQALTDLRRRYSLADRTRTRLQLVMDSAIALSSATTEDRLAEILADTSARAYRAEESTVYLHQPDGTTAVAAGQNPLNDTIDPEALIALVTTPHQVRKVVGESEAEDLIPGLGAAMSKAGVHSLVAAPLHHEEIDFGAFVSWFHHDRTFDDEAAPLAEALANQAAQALATLRLQTRLAHAATHDEVTGLPNRRLLEAELGDIIGTSACAAIFIDLDGFKSVNDRLGHQAGDRMLRDAGLRILSAVRADDLVARYGGDEFVLACRVTDPAVAREIAGRILDELRGDPEHPAAAPPLRASIGVAVAPEGSRLRAEQLIRRADLAMYRAKSSGGDRIVLAEE